MTDLYVTNVTTQTPIELRQHMAAVLSELALLLEGNLNVDQLKAWLKERSPGAEITYNESLIYRCQRCKGKWPCFDFTSGCCEGFTCRTDGEVAESTTDYCIKIGAHQLTAQRVKNF